MSANTKTEYEKCVICHRWTDVPVDRHINLRRYFVAGVGELCEECYSQLINDNLQKNCNILLK